MDYQQDQADIEVEALKDFKDFDKLTKYLKDSARLMSKSQIRFLVSVYYQIQDERKRFASQLKAREDAAHPNLFLEWMLAKWKNFESNLKTAMNLYCLEHVPTRWAMTQVGIGPVLAAGFYSHIDIEKANTAGKVWRFAGLDPTLVWLGKKKSAELVERILNGSAITTEKLASIASVAGHNLAWLETKIGQHPKKDEIVKLLSKCPYNQELKTLAWKASECFVKFCNHDDAVYGKVYIDRKIYEWKNNLAGKLADQAAKKINDFNIGKSTAAWKWYSGCYDSRGYDGPVPPFELQKKNDSEELEMKVLLPLKNPDEGVRMLPPAHIQARAQRKTVSLFLAHFQHVYYESHYGKKPPKPYIIEHGGHTDFIEPPNWRDGKIVNE